MTMPVELPAKLRVTMTVLDCRSRKELAARFRARNPRTACEIDSLHKWMQGRATPRGEAFYDEWANLLGLSQGGRFIAECGLDAFMTLLAGQFAVTRVALQEAAAPPGPRATSNATGHGLVGGAASIAGAWIAYSRALSPHHQGQLLRGTLRLAPERGDGLRADYREQLDVGPVTMTGTARLGGRALTIQVTEPGSGVVLVLVLHLPGPPVTVLCGLLTCPALIASEPLMASTPFLAVRVPDAASLDTANGYLRPQPGLIAFDLSVAAAIIPDLERFDRQVLDFLSPYPLLVPLATQSALSAALQGVALYRTSVSRSVESVD